MKDDGDTGPAASAGEIRVDSEASIVAVRRAIREVVTSMGFGITDVTRVVTAASELARNIYCYARTGNVRWRVVVRGSAQGIEIVFQDEGPGIVDVDLALREGWSTSGGLGMGLPGSRRLTDELDLVSGPGQGTVVTVRKWRR